MPSFFITQVVNYAGSNYSAPRTVSGDNFVQSEPIGGVPAAPSGVLTTRTNNTDGTATMDSGSHGIVTGSRVDIYWSGGARYGATAGTVSGTTVPFTGGSGDNLPVQASVIYVCNPHVENVSFTGNNAVGMLAYASLVNNDLYGQVVFTQSDNTFIAAYRLTPTSPVVEWDQAPNPFSGVTVGKVYMSHGNPTARTMGTVVLYN